MCRKPSPRKRNLLKVSPQRRSGTTNRTCSSVRAATARSAAQKKRRRLLKSEIHLEGILGEVRLDTVDCLGFCKYGPNAIIYDGTDSKGTWYLGLDESEAPEVVEH